MVLSRAQIKSKGCSTYPKGQAVTSRSPSTTACVDNADLLRDMAFQTDSKWLITHFYCPIYVNMDYHIRCLVWSNGLLLIGSYLRTTDEFIGSNILGSVRKGTKSAPHSPRRPPAGRRFYHHLTHPLSAQSDSQVRMLLKQKKKMTIPLLFC